MNALSTGWDNMMSAISSKVGAKAGKIGSKIGATKLGQCTKGLFKKATQCLTKHFGKVSAKITAILGGDAALTSTGIGALVVVAKNVGMAGILAINEASNPRNLFYVDSDYDCDWIMYAIAAGIGALKGTTPGSVIDIVNELVASILGLDLIHEVACAIYNLICNAIGDGEKYEKLKEGKDKQKKNYEKYKEKQIKEQYSAYAKSKGKTEDEYTMEQYRADLESGAATLDVDSFVDFNHKQNKTIGAKTTDAIVGAGKKVSKGWKALRGYTTSTFYDESTGITYEKNDDDTYTMYDKDGNNLGNIAQANVDTSKMKETKTKHKGSVGSTVAALTNTVHKTVGDAGNAVIDAGKSIGGGIVGGWKSAIGGGVEGIKQMTSGDFVGGVKTIASGIGKGYINSKKGVFNAVGSLAKGTGKVILDLGSGLVNTAKGIGDDVVNIGKGIGKGIVNFFTSESEEVYRNPEDGSYYKVVDGKWILHNNNGDKISDEPLADGDLISLVRAGTLIQDTITTRESGFKKTKDAVLDSLGKAGNAIGGAFKKAGKALGDAASRVADGAGIVFASITNAGSNVIDYFSSSTKTVYVTQDGSYYDSDGKYYSANGQPIESGNIEKDELNSLIRSGMVLINEKTIESQALTDLKGSLSNLGKSISKGWNNLGSFVSNVVDNIGKTGTKLLNAGKTFFGKATDKAYKAALAVSDEIYANPDGSYYDSDGKYYTAQGEHIESNDISKEDLYVAYKSGTVTKQLKPNFNKVKKTAGKAFKNMIKAGSNAWNNLQSFGKKFLDGASKLGDKFGEIGDVIKEKGVFGAIESAFKTTTKEAWYAPDGSYYTVNKDGTYNHYSATNDLLQENITGKDAEYIDTQITTGVFKKDTITEQSAASEAVSGMKDAISKGWEDAKGTVVDGWNKIKNGLGSMFGFGGAGGFGGLGDSINTLKENISSYIPKKKPKKEAGGFGPDNGTINGFKYYSQKDSEWASAEYDSSKAKDNATMGEAGCGPTAMAMVASQYSGRNVTPVDMAKLAETGGFRDETGTNSNFISYAGNKYNLQNTRVEDPGADYIKGELAKGKSVVLNGISGGMPNSPFTSKGHYVVAVGTDKDGNILVNDPRGAGYSTAYSPEMIQSQSRMAWSFGKAGKGDKVEYIKSKNPVGGSGKKKKKQKVSPDDFAPGKGSPAYEANQKKKKGKKQKKGDSSTTDTGKNWLAIVEAVKKAIASQKPGYSQSRFITITVNGRSMKARTDCSGYVGTCLKYYGVLDEGTNVTSRTFSSSNFPALSNNGFTHMPFSSWENLKAGDIISLPGHVEIFCEIKNGQHYVYNCGSDKSVNSPTPTISGHSSYTDVWRPGDAGSADGSISAGESSDNSASSGSNESTDALSIISSHFSSFASKAMSGMLTGKWDNDFSSITSAGSSTSDNSDSSGGDASAANIKGSNTAEKVWNFFTSNGYSPEATAGIMGNFQQESGMNPASIQGNGKGPAAGIAQWENYNTKSSRWKNLSDYAEKNGYKWTDLEPQLEFVHKELQNLGAFWKYQPNMDKAGTTATTYEDWKKSTDIDAATRQFEGAFERAGKPMMDNRLSAAKKYYGLYNGKTGGKGGDDEVPLSIKDVQGLEDDPILSSLTGGYGKGKNSKRKPSKGKSSVVKTTTLRNAKPVTKTTKSLGLSGTDNSKLESLLSKMISILESIDSHSGESVKKLDLLKTGNTTNVKTGDNITVQQSSGTNNSKQKSGESRNAILANKIARGY